MLVFFTMYNPYHMIAHGSVVKTMINAAFSRSFSGTLFDRFPLPKINYVAAVSMCPKKSFTPKALQCFPRICFLTTDRMLCRLTSFLVLNVLLSIGAVG